MLNLGASLYINDRSMADYGFNAFAPGSWASGPAQQDRLTSVPGFAGSMLTSAESSMGTRTLTLAGTFGADNRSEAISLWDQIQGILANPVLEVRFAAWPDRVGYARYRGITWDAITSWENGAPFTLTLEMPNPYKVARSFDVYTIASGTQVPIMLGTAPSDVRLLVMGIGLSNPGVRYRDAQGSIRGEVLFGLTIVGTWVTYESDWQLSTKYTYNQTTPPTVIPYIPHDVPELILTRPFVLDPSDGIGTVGPTLEAVACDVVAHVRRCWR